VATYGILSERRTDMAIADIKGIKSKGSARYDRVLVEVVAGKVSIRATDGYYRDTATALLDLKAAHKLCLAIADAINAAQSAEI
jgi:hypothetical protein